MWRVFTCIYICIYVKYIYLCWTMNIFQQTQTHKHYKDIAQISTSSLQKRPSSPHSILIRQLGTWIKLQHRLEELQWLAMWSPAGKRESCHSWAITLQIYCMNGIISPWIATNGIRHGAFIFIKEKYSVIKPNHHLQYIAKPYIIQNHMKYKVKTSICIATGLTPTAAFHKPESKPNQSGLTIREHRMAHN